MMAARQREFTGRHMLAIMVVFFGIIIAVNVTMAVYARKTWSGLVVPNTYVASQQFNEKMAETRAQAALGWTATLTIENGHTRYAIVDSLKNGVALKSVALKFMHPVEDRADQTLVLKRNDDGSYIATETITDGVWLVEVKADAGLAKPFRETLRIHIAKGGRT